MGNISAGEDRVFAVFPARGFGAKGLILWGKVFWRVWSYPALEAHKNVIPGKRVPGIQAGSSVECATPSPEAGNRISRDKPENDFARGRERGEMTTVCGARMAGFFG
jgi:hypothetical protein